LICRDGFWHAQGECFQDGANATQVGAAQILLQLSLEIDGAAESGLAWAQQHQEPLHWAFARTLSNHPAELRLELLAPPASARTRRLSVAFGARLTWLLGAAPSLAALQQAAQELASLAEVDGQTRFETALREQLNTTIAATAQTSGPEVIEGYLLPEAHWQLGAWDTASCDAVCADGGNLSAAEEVAEVFCSRGMWMLCAGPAEAFAGSPPSGTRPCRQCAAGPQEAAVPVWAVLLGLAVGFCCCTILGVFLAGKCLKWVARAMPATPFAGKQNLKDMKMEAKYHVQPAARRMKSRKTVGFEDTEGGFLRRLTTMRPTSSMQSARSTQTGASEAEVAGTKTKVIWDVDMSQLSTMFVQQTYSSNVAPENSNPSSPSPTGRAQRVGKKPSFEIEDVENQKSGNESPSQLSPAGRERSGTLLDMPDGPVCKLETVETIITLRNSTL